jgi:hypothetical protein
MHNCPSCGSYQIQLLIERTGGNVSFGGAMAGAVIGEILLGDAGGIVGGIVGAKAFSNPIQETEINYCMNCGNRWNARELFELISVISHLLDAEIDLSIELHRYCLAEFVNTIIPKISRYILLIACPVKTQTL